MVVKKTKNRSNSSAVSLDTKILGFNASHHFFLIIVLYVLLLFVLGAALAYNHAKFPDTIFGNPAPPEMAGKMKQDALLKGLGATGIAPFFVFLIATVILAFVRFKMVYTAALLVTVLFMFVIVVYNGVVLFYFKLRFIWPPLILMEIAKPSETNPPTPRELVVYPLTNFCKVFITALTVCMCAVAVIQAYCALLLINLSLWYRPPVELYAAKMPRARKTMEEEEEEESEKEEEGDAEEGKK